MNTSVSSNHQLNDNPEQRSPASLYHTVTLNGQRVRVLKRELDSHQKVVNAWAVFWCFATLALGLLVISQIYQTGVKNSTIQFLPLLVFFVLVSIVQQTVCWFQRKTISRMMLGWSTSCLIFSLVICLLTIFEVNWRAFCCFIFCTNECIQLWG